MALPVYFWTYDLNSKAWGGFGDYDRQLRLSSCSEFSRRPFARGICNQYEICAKRNTHPEKYPRMDRGMTPMLTARPIGSHSRPIGSHSRPPCMICCLEPYCWVHRGDLALLLKPLSSSPKDPPIKLDELDFNCLEEIVKLLDGSSIRALGQVNSKLRSALAYMNLREGCQPPYLILSEGSHSEICRLLRLHRHGNMLLSPAASGKRIWGSAHGWIVTMDPNDQLHFRDISFPDQEPLPPLPMIDDIEWLDWFLIVQKCLVFKIFPPEFLVMIILHPGNVLYFTKPRKIPQWVLVSNPENSPIFRDFAFFQRQVYALCDNGSIVKINFHESDLAATATLLVVSNMEDEIAERSYLVATPDHLYGVFRYDDEDDGRTTFVVYKLNFDSLEWEAVFSIEDYAFFVGGGNSLCYSPDSSDDYRKNCIYFTNEDSLIFPNEGRFDFGIYDLDTWRADLKRVKGEGVPVPHSCSTWIAYDLTPPNFRN